MINIIEEKVKNQIVDISKILDTIGERVEGNLICDISSNNLIDHVNESKIYNLLKLSEGKSKICEIGVNAGHSLLLMINKNPLAEYLIFDLGGHRYTKPCVDYIKKQYPSTKITEVYGDTNITLKEYVKSNEKHTFDMIHIDGGHDTPTVINDFTYTQDLLTSDGVVIFDDYNYENIKRVIDNYKLEGVIYPYKENLVETNLHYVYKFNNKNK